MLDAGFGFIRFLVCGLCFFTSLLVSLVLAVGNRSRMSLYRVLINVAGCLLFFPTIRAGSLLRDRLFLRHLARFQELTYTLIADERARARIVGFGGLVGVELEALWLGETQEGAGGVRSRAGRINWR